MRGKEAATVTGDSVRYGSDDEAAQHWLTILRDDPNHLTTDARLGLAGIFERRGMPVEAADLLESCIAAGHKEAETFERLAILYEAHGRPGRAAKTRANAKLWKARRARRSRALDRGPAAARATAPSMATAQVTKGLLWIILGLALSVGAYVAAGQDGGGR